MSDDKSEEPTEKKKQKSREDGQIPAQKNTIEALVLTLAVILIMTIFSKMAMAVAALYDSTISAIEVVQTTANFSYANALVAQDMGDITTIALIFSAGLSMIVLLIGLAVNKMSFSMKKLTPQFTKFNPVTGFKNMFSKAALINTVRMAVHFSALSVFLYFIVWLDLEDIVDAASCGTSCTVTLVLGKINSLITFALVIALFVGVLDFKFQIAESLKKMKMSKDEVKREQKESNGSPEMMQERHKIGQEILHLPSIKDVNLVFFANQRVLALVKDPGRRTRTFVAMKATGAAAEDLSQRLKTMGAQVVNNQKALEILFPLAKPNEYSSDAFEQALAQFA